jgi:hypothetical protein
LHHHPEHEARDEPGDGAGSNGVSHGLILSATVPLPAYSAARSSPSLLGRSPRETELT